MVSEARNKLMAWMETDYSTYLLDRWKIKWRLERLGAPGIMGKALSLPVPIQFNSSEIVLQYLHLQSVSRHSKRLRSKTVDARCV